VIAPVRLIDGAELAQLMTEHSVGVQHAKGKTQRTGRPPVRATEAPKAVTAHYGAEAEEARSEPKSQDNTICLVQLRLVARPSTCVQERTKKAALPRRS
jgi:hypothetical protein